MIYTAFTALFIYGVHIKINAFSLFLSGTAVDDDLVLEMGSLSLVDVKEGMESIRELGSKSNNTILGESEPSYDFLLTAQGGLKGTSKPIYYRVRR